MLKEKSTLLLDFSTPDHSRWKALLDYSENAKHDEDIEILQTILASDPNPIIRHEVAFLLSHFNSPQVTDALAMALAEEKNPLVRHEIAEALSFHTLTPRAMQVLEKLKDDQVAEVRQTAKMVLEMKKPEMPLAQTK